MAKMNEGGQPQGTPSLIAHGTNIRGEIECGGDLRIDGSIDGNVTVQGRLVVGERGRIVGEVSCQDCDISGYLKGRIFVKDLLSLKGTSRLFGDMTTKKLSIEAGSVFTGTCQMGEDTEAGRGGQGRSGVGSVAQPAGKE